MARKVAVIGAGLAGLYAAQSAAVHGAEVTLFERGIIGTKHNCGEMFTEIYTSVPDECKLNRIKYFSIIAKGEVIQIKLGDNSPFVMTDKCLHELIMKRKCEEAGVEVIEKINTSSQRDSIQGSYIIDASGTSGYNLDMGKAAVYIKKWNIDESFCGINIKSDEALFHIRDDMMGYGWAFPRGNNKLNVGEGVYDYKYNVNLNFPDYIPGASSNDITFRGGGLIPMPTMDQYYYNKCGGGMSIIDGIKVGNAAGLVNPLAGGGEHLAVLSGMLAGELVANKREQNYYTALDEIVGDEMRIGISLYELLKKQDIDSAIKIMKSGILNCIDYEVANQTVRKAMKKWLTLPEVTNDELTEFAGE